MPHDGEALEAHTVGAEADAALARGNAQLFIDGVYVVEVGQQKAASPTYASSVRRASSTHGSSASRRSHMSAAWCCTYYSPKLRSGAEPAVPVRVNAATP